MLLKQLGGAHSFPAAVPPNKVLEELPDGLLGWQVEKVRGAAGSASSGSKWQSGCALNSQGPAGEEVCLMEFVAPAASPAVVALSLQLLNQPATYRHLHPPCAEVLQWLVAGHSGRPVARSQERRAGVSRDVSAFFECLQGLLTCGLRRRAGVSRRDVSCAVVIHTPGLSGNACIANLTVAPCSSCARSCVAAGQALLKSKPLHAAA